MKPRRLRKVKRQLRMEKEKLHSLLNMPVHRFSGELQLQVQTVIALEKQKTELKLQSLNLPTFNELPLEFAAMELLRRTDRVDGTVLSCPECGDGNRGNTNQGVPWCFKCRRPLTQGKTKSAVSMKELVDKCSEDPSWHVKGRVRRRR